MTLDIEQYRTAAVLMCERMGIEPQYRGIETSHAPNWIAIAQRMAEHCLMVEVLRECGRYPDKKE